MKPIFLVREPSYAIGRSQETQERLKHLGGDFIAIGASEMARLSREHTMLSKI